MIALILILGPIALGAFSVRQRVTPGWSGAPARLVEIIISLSLLQTVGLILGTVGAFQPILMAGGCLVVGLGLAALCRLRSTRTVTTIAANPVSSPARSYWWTDLLALGLAALTLGQWAKRSVKVALNGINDGDSLFYHLPHAAQFVQDAKIILPHFTVDDPLYSYFPANVELLNATMILPFHYDTLSAFLSMGWMLLALLAAWCIGQPFGVGASTLAVTTVVLNTPVMLKYEAGTAQVGVAILALLLAAIALLIHAQWDPALVGLAGIAAGLAVGSKYSALAPVGVLTVAVVILAPRGNRYRIGAIWSVGLALTGAFWYIRNLLLIGNPVPGVTGVGPFRLASPVSESLNRYGQSLLDYGNSIGTWTSDLPIAFRSEFGLLWLPLLVAALIGTVMAVFRARCGIVRMVAVASLAVLGLYVVTPFTAAGVRGSPFFGPALRFLTLFLCLALIGVVLASSRARYARTTVVLGASVGMLGMVGSGTWGGLLIAIGLSAGIVAVGSFSVFALRHQPFVGQAGRMVASGMALWLTIAGGWFAQERVLESRYRNYSGENGVLWAWAQDVRNARIATVGTMLNFPLYGPDLSNTVRYVGKEVADGGFLGIDDCQEFIDALARGDYDYVVTGSVKVSRLFERRAEPESEWLRSQPGATELVRAGGFAVFGLDASVPLLPRRCPEA